MKGGILGKWGRGEVAVRVGRGVRRERTGREEARHWVGRKVGEVGVGLAFCRSDFYLCVCLLFCLVYSVPLHSVACWSAGLAENAIIHCALLRRET